MQFSLHAILFIVTNISGRVEADSFNYRYTSGDNYGPAEWNKVDCNGLEDCPGWPDKHLSSIGWELEENQCLWCPETGNQCPVQHRMSPVNLVRDRAIEDNPNWKDCPDWHWYVIMSFLMNRRMCSFLVLFRDDLLTLFPLLYYVIG